jgi:hypothetical protein
MLSCCWCCSWLLCCALQFVVAVTNPNIFLQALDTAGALHGTETGVHYERNL